MKVKKWTVELLLTVTVLVTIGLLQRKKPKSEIQYRVSPYEAEGNAIEGEMN